MFQQGMKNYIMNFGPVFETVLACILSHTPGMDKGLRMYPLKFNLWLPAIPFSILISCYDRTRKLLLRLNPEGCIEQVRVNIIIFIREGIKKKFDFF